MISVSTAISLESNPSEELFANEGRPYLMVMIGKSFRGKSYMLRYILTHHLASGKLKFGMVFTNTPFTGDYNFLPKDIVRDGYDETILAQYIGNLRRIRETNGYVEPNFIVFDDLVGVLDNQTKFFSNWITTFRHTNTYVYIAVQYLTGRNSISPVMREQTDYAIIFKSRTQQTLDALYNSYGGMFPSVTAFNKYLQSATHGKYIAVLYSEHEDDIGENYKAISAPDDYQKIKFEF